MDNCFERFVLLFIILCSSHLCAQNISDSSVKQVSSFIYPFQSDVDGTWHYINDDGIPVPDPDSVIQKAVSIIKAKGFIVYSGFYEGLVEISDTGYHVFGFADTAGAIIVPPIFLKVMHFSEGRAVIKTDKGYGYIDRSGKIIAAPQFQMAESFSDGYAAVELEDGWGYIDNAGHNSIPCKFSSASSFKHNLAIVSNDSGYFYISPIGDWAFPGLFEDATDFYDGRACVEIKGKYGFIDTTGKMIIPPKFEGKAFFYEGIAAVRRKGLYGFIDKWGHYTIPAKFEDVGDFSEGLALVQKGNLYGYIDMHGEMVIPPSFSEVQPFHNGMALFRQGRLYGYINKKGKILIPPQYKKAYQFNGKLAKIVFNESLPGGPYGRLNGAVHYIDYAYIDTTGRVIVRWSSRGFKTVPDYSVRAFSGTPTKDIYVDIIPTLVKSKPEGAKVYFIPLHVFEDDKNIINEPNKLSCRLQSRYTTNKFKVYEQVYIVLLEYGNKKVIRQLDVNSYNDNFIYIDFDKEP